LLLYYITDRKQFSGDETSQRKLLLDRISAAAHAGVDYIQLREKDLSAGDLEALAVLALHRIRLAGSSSRLLINSRIDAAIAAGAAGVHLPAEDITSEQARKKFMHSGIAQPVIAASCHSVEDVIRTKEDGADFVVFGPVFEKSGKNGVGLDRLREACAAAGAMPVLALGGVTPENAAACAEAGAAGVAGIRMFQAGDVAQFVPALRRLSRK
jgi:thiamine-phosphate pyrophosphorylase